MKKILLLLGVALALNADALLFQSEQISLKCSEKWYVFMDLNGRVEKIPFASSTGKAIVIGFLSGALDVNESKAAEFLGVCTE